MTTTRVSARSYAGEADLQPIADLLNFCYRFDQIDEDYSADDLRTEYSSPDFDAAHNIRLWQDAGGQLVAYAEISFGRENPEQTVLGGFFYIRIHPENRITELEDEIVAWAEKRIREVGHERNMPAEMTSGTTDSDQYMIGILERYGMKVVRYFFRMVRDLVEPIPELNTPTGYTLRTVASAEDEEHWVDAYNWSFIDHYDFRPRTVEYHRHALSEAAYSRNRDLIAVAEDGTIAAFAFCWIDPASNERNNRREGWISMLGVRRGHRGNGLGRAMLFAGLHRLQADGMAQAKLGVDAENPHGALQLYESAGFQRQLTWARYAKRLT